MRVKFQTFKPGQNDGEVVPLGEHEVVVVCETFRNARHYSGVCCSREVKDESMQTVTFGDRTFVVSNGRVSLPSDFNAAAFGITPKLARVRCPLCDSSANLHYCEYEEVRRPLLDNDKLRVGSGETTGRTRDSMWSCSACRNAWPVTDQEARDIVWR